MFGKKKPTPPRNEDLQLPVVNIAPATGEIISGEIEYRPCYAKGKKALFHRWANTANPITPRGVDPSDERARFFQYRATQAVVEYEDGTVERVWPQDIRFADSTARFKEYDWEPCGQKDEEKEK